MLLDWQQHCRPLEARFPPLGELTLVASSSSSTVAVVSTGIGRLVVKVVDDPHRSPGRELRHAVEARDLGMAVPHFVGASRAALYYAYVEADQGSCGEPTSVALRLWQGFLAQTRAGARRRRWLDVRRLSLLASDGRHGSVLPGTSLEDYPTRVQDIAQMLSCAQPWLPSNGDVRPENLVLSGGVVVILDWQELCWEPPLLVAASVFSEVPMSRLKELYWRASLRHFGTEEDFLAAIRLQSWISLRRLRSAPNLQDVRKRYAERLTYLSPKP